MVSCSQTQLRVQADHLTLSAHISRIACTFRFVSSRFAVCCRSSGSLPSEYYSTTDPASFDKFLSRCDMLIASLPSTPATKYMITKEHFGEWHTRTKCHGNDVGDQASCRRTRSSLMSGEGTWRGQVGPFDESGRMRTLISSAPLLLGCCCFPIWMLYYHFITASHFARASPRTPIAPPYPLHRRHPRRPRSTQQPPRRRTRRHRPRTLA